MENEYANFDKADKAFIQFLVDHFKTSGFDGTLLYTSDGPFSGDRGTIEGILWTGNFNRDAQANLNELQRIQPNKPLMVMEYWTGGFDFWFGQHETGLSVSEFRENLEIILGEFNASVNFYMFQGGTNFGFMSGSEIDDFGGYNAITTSYDYDAPLTEAGDYTEKYNVIVELVEKYSYPKLRKPPQPFPSMKQAYDSVVPQFYLGYDQIIQQIPWSSQFNSEKPTHMEVLDMNGGSGQSYGYLIHRLYSTTAQNGSTFKADIVRDFATVVVDGKLQTSSFSGDGAARYWIYSEREIILDLKHNPGDLHFIDLIIENMARLKLGREEEMKQPKGLPEGHIFLDGVEQIGFKLFSLEFNSGWLQNLTNFQMVEDVQLLKAPLIVRSTFEVVGEPLDTWVDLSGWHKGLVFINGFNLGRYFKMGPQQSIYVPSNILSSGVNTIMIFEQLEPGTEIKFRDTPDFK